MPEFTNSHLEYTGTQFRIVYDTTFGNRFQVFTLHCAPGDADPSGEDNYEMRYFVAPVELTPDNVGSQMRWLYERLCGAYMVGAE